MKHILLIVALMTAVTSQAVIYTTNWNTGFANGGVVPDNNLSGWIDSRLTDAAPAGTVQIGSVAVTLNLSGGWNGDLYAYLVNNSSSGFSVLLDRVGQGESGVSAFGYGDAGMNVTLAATGTSIQQYGGNSTFTAPPTGTWMTDNTSGSLGSFTTQNGTWSLFIADLGGGGISTVQSWGLQMDIVAVPEVETWVAAALAGAFGAFWLNRQMFSRKRRG